jgi:hypothetical protein
MHDTKMALPISSKNIRYVNRPFQLSCKGIQEGIARCTSQLITYPFESYKINLQVHGSSNHKFRTHGIIQSSLTSGMVFTLYFSIYNSLKENPFASTIASVITSVFKIPLANSMRLLLLNNHKTNIIQCASKIIKDKGVIGLYSGFSASMFEDIIEHNIRNNIYEYGTYNFDNHIVHTLFGCIAASVAAGITTPFDTIKSNLVHEKSNHNIIKITYKIINKNGICGLYRGCTVRTLSNATRFGMYYIIIETISIIYNNKLI